MDDVDGLLVRESSLAVKVILEESDVRLGRISFVEELLPARLVEGGRLDFLDYALGGGDGGAVVLDVHAEIDRRGRERRAIADRRERQLSLSSFVHPTPLCTA